MKGFLFLPVFLFSMSLGFFFKEENTFIPDESDNKVVTEEILKSDIKLIERYLDQKKFSSLFKLLKRDLVAFPNNQQLLELKKKAISISPAGVRCVWLRHDLENIKKRLKLWRPRASRRG